MQAKITQTAEQIKIKLSILRFLINYLDIVCGAYVSDCDCIQGNK